MNKRGSHIDWVMSMGIFILFILLILGFFKPSYRPSFEGSTLLDIVQRGLESVEEDAEGNTKGFSWEVSKSPIFIQECKEKRSREDEESTPQRSNRGFEEGNVRIVNQFRDISGGFFVYKDSNVPKSEYERIGNGISLPPFRGTINNFEVEISPETKDRDSFWNFWVFFSDASYGQISNFKDEWMLICHNPEPFRGEISKYAGFKEEKLNDLKRDNVGDGRSGYQKFKDDWNFPEGREFKIVILELTGPENAKIYTPYNEYGFSGEPYEEAEVFVREWKYNILDKYGNRREVIVSMRVW